MRKRTDGFTLVELMVVILVIGILVAVAVPVFKAARTRAETNTCQANQRTWAGVVQQAKAAGDEPTSTEGLKMLSNGGGSAWYDIATTYLKSVPVCPTSKTAYWVYEDVRGTPANGNVYGCAAGSAQWTDGHGLIDQADSGSVIVWQGLVYKVVTAKDGRQWLDRNLGAKQVAKSSTDVDSYGWLYQWGRKGDGHQYTEWGGAQASAAKSGTTVGPSTSITPGELFVARDDWDYTSDWLSSADPTLWQASGINNPCPKGFHVPTQLEWNTMSDREGICSADTALKSALRLPVAGYRESTGQIKGKSSEGIYWSSSVSGTGSKALYLNLTATNVGRCGDTGAGRARGFSIRAIKDLSPPSGP